MVNLRAGEGGNLALGAWWLVESVCETERDRERDRDRQRQRQREVGKATQHKHAHTHTRTHTHTHTHAHTLALAAHPQQNEHQGRKLSWAYQLSKGELTTHYLKKPFVFQANLIQIVSLLLFNNQKSMSRADIQKATEIEPVCALCVSLCLCVFLCACVCLCV